MYDSTTGKFYDSLGYEVTRARCIPLMCGVPSSPPDLALMCSEMGAVGNLSCGDPSCTPYAVELAAAKVCPQVASIVAGPLPSQTITTADLTNPTKPSAPLTTANIMTPLPSITASYHPVPAPVPDTNPWCQINQAILDHPVIALALLAGVTAMMARGEHGR